MYRDNFARKFDIEPFVKLCSLVFFDVYSVLRFQFHSDRRTRLFHVPYVLPFQDFYDMVSKFGPDRV